MEPDFKCNSFKCRKPLPSDSDAKAVVTTCSHIFCIECANELFSTARICPACETSLTEADDVVICSLRPTNDYKTTVLSGLNPVTVLEICGRAISFWNYQVQQEYSFQQIIFKNANERMAHMQKQLDNVIREANGQLSLLSEKVSGLERDLELERRRSRDLQEVTRDRDKEYQKLKNQLDKYKRKALLGQGSMATASLNTGAPSNPHPTDFFGSASTMLNVEHPHQSTPARHHSSMQNESYQSHPRQPGLQNPIPTPRSRPQRLNPAEVQYTAPQEHRSYRTVSPTESLQSNQLPGRDSHRQHRQHLRPTNAMPTHQSGVGLQFTSNNAFAGPAMQSASRRSGTFHPAGFVR